MFNQQNDTYINKSEELRKDIESICSCIIHAGDDSPECISETLNDQIIKLLECQLKFHNITTSTQQTP